MAVYDREALKRHLTEHSMCEYCKTYYYGVDELFDHLRTAHYWCSICQEQGSHVYFPTLEAYDAHLRYRQPQLQPCWHP